MAALPPLDKLRESGIPDHNGVAEAGEKQGYMDRKVANCADLQLTRSRLGQRAGKVRNIPEAMAASQAALSGTPWTVGVALLIL